jgi:hypothetical protein
MTEDQPQGGDERYKDKNHEYEYTAGKKTAPLQKEAV